MNMPLKPREKNGLALNTGPDFHLLDHIGPIAALLSIPLLTTEEENTTLAKKYYPQVETRYMPNLETSLGKIAEEFDVLFECKYFVPHLKALFRNLYKKEMRLVFCPHGYSDKGALAPLLAPYALQDAVLLYGTLHKERLQELSIWPLQNYAITGNYRRLFYEKHRSFYDDLAEREVFSAFPKKQPILLYAPTWNDADGATSFFDHSEWIFSEMPSDWNLLIKVHPLLEQRDPARYYKLANKAGRRANTVLVSHFPPVFPILARTDAFLGDFSSVGYDFLCFRKPMFFLPDARLPKGRLHACGTILERGGMLREALNAPPKFEEEQGRLFAKAFGNVESLEETKRAIQKLLCTEREIA